MSAVAIDPVCVCDFSDGDNPACPTHGREQGLIEYRGQAHPYELSRYQKAVVDWFLDGHGNAVVNAVAGSGKTATLECLAKYVTQSAVFCAFNKHIADELSAKLRWHQTIQVRTLHSIGYAATRYKLRCNPKVDATKYSTLIRQLLREVISTSKVAGKPTANGVSRWVEETNPFVQLKELCNMARVNLLKEVDGPAILSLANTYAIDIEVKDLGFYKLALPALLKAGEASMRSVMDFTDMIWAPWLLAAMPYRNTVVMVDEAQDLNKAQLDLALKCVKADGRMLFVGDPFQSIYGFAGSMSDSIDLIIKSTAATVLPLNECYRCPTSHIQLAQAIVPHIEATSWAKTGEVKTIKEDELCGAIEAGDLIICRLTAPLIRQAFGLIKDGVAAKVRGRQIGEALVAVLDRLAKGKSYRWESLKDHVGEWSDGERVKILNRNGNDHEDPQLQNISDQADSLLALLAYSGASSMLGLKQHIAQLFSDEQATVWLSTVHRAKGLESDRVFILRPDMMPLPFVKGGWQLRQEWNLRYVALTRAKHSLTFVKGD